MSLAAKRSKYSGCSFYDFFDFAKRKPQHSRILEYILKIQSQFCEILGQYETKHFNTDHWERPDGNGGGIACVLQNGKVFDKAAACFSVFAGPLSVKGSEQLRERHKCLASGRLSCFVTGVSAIIHNVNPYVPCFHFNIRYFEVKDANGTEVWWFGGCCDLAPYYIFDEELSHYHKNLKDICDKHNNTYYERYKQWCDEYFLIKHRGETRGVGGIFFDDLNDASFESCFAFVQSLGDSLLSLFVPLLTKHMDDKYGEREKKWQLYLRGRHLEFIFMYDRGFRFGVNMPQARVESFMITVPTEARFEYCYGPEPGSEEHRTLEIWKNPRNWVDAINK